MTSPSSPPQVSAARIVAAIRPGIEPSAAHDKRLRAALSECRSAWPEVSVEPAAFLRHLAESLPPGEPPVEVLDKLAITDLYLAFACGEEDAAALRAIETRYFAQVPGFVARFRESGVFVDEVTQTLRSRLLVPEEGRRPRILEYTGQGALHAWLRVAAVRTALNLRRGRQALDAAHERARDEPEPSPTAGMHPELDYLRRAHKGALEAAFRTALSELETQDATLIRLYFIERLTVGQLGAMMKVDKSTISRRLFKAREAIVDRCRSLLRERLAVGDSDLDSVLRLVRSQVDLSFGALAPAGQEAEAVPSPAVPDRAK